MERRQWASFVAVAQELPFSRVAERLDIAQPGASQQVARPERELARCPPGRRRLLPMSSGRVTGLF